jgi:hypothetical protein
MQAINWVSGPAMDARDPVAVAAGHAAGTVPLIGFPEYGASGGRLCGPGDRVMDRRAFIGTLAGGLFDRGPRTNPRDSAR